MFFWVVETKKAITIIVTACFTSESAGVRTAKPKSRYRIAQGASPSNKLPSIGSTRIKWVGTVDYDEQYLL